jgi:hypothetical protein
VTAPGALKQRVVGGGRLRLGPPDRRRLSSRARRGLGVPAPQLHLQLLKSYWDAVKGRIEDAVKGRIEDAVKGRSLP